MHCPGELVAGTQLATQPLHRERERERGEREREREREGERERKRGATLGNAA